MAYTLERVNDGVWLLTMDNGENRFSPKTMARLTQLLEEVENDPKSRVLITTGTGKFYSNGLDLPYMQTCKSRTEVEAFLSAYQVLMAKMLTMPVYTVAAVNGHAFAGGFMFALAHDFRLMRTGRGYMCLNEIDLGMVMSPGMMALCVTKMTDPSLQRDTLLVGKRYSAEQALSVRLIDSMHPEEEVIPSAVGVAGQLAKKDASQTTLHGMKMRLYEDAVAKLRSPARASL